MRGGFFSPCRDGKCVCEEPYPLQLETGDYLHILRDPTYGVAIDYTSAGLTFSEAAGMLEGFLEKHPRWARRG